MTQTANQELHLLKVESEDKLRMTVKSLLFLCEESYKLHQPIVFQKFKFQNGAHDFESMFFKDKPNYSYESIKVKRKEEKALKALIDAEKGKVDANAEGKLNRSVEELSMSDDEDPPPPPPVKKTDSKPPEKPTEDKPKKSGWFW